MSELRLSLDHLQIPHEDCNFDPEQVAGLDDCHVVLRVTDSEKPEPGEEEWRKLRFDRKGSDFSVSLKAVGGADEFLNPQEDVSWFFSHRETGQILQQVRIFGHFLPSKGIAKPSAVERADRAELPMVLAHYILEGKVVFPGKPQALTEGDLAAMLLNVFANSDAEAVRELLGRIAYFQADAALKSESQDRARWIVGILQSIPRYQKFLQRLLPLDIHFDPQDPASVEALDQMQAFAANTVVNVGHARILRYDAATQRAARAYAKLYELKKRPPDFCSNLSRAITVLPAARAQLSADFVEECRLGLRLQRMPAEPAARASLREFLESPRGLAALQNEVASEVKRSHMPIDWLKRRGQMDAAIADGFAAMLFVSSKSGADLELRVDAHRLQSLIQRGVETTRASRHREPLLASLALLRWVFGETGKKASVRVFFAGEFQEIPLRYEAKPIQALLSLLERELRHSLRGSELALPLGEGAVAVLGGAGLGMALGLRGFNPRGRNALGYTAAGLTGLGVGALLTHFIVPPLAKKSKRPVRNKYLWDLVGGTIGASVGVSVWGAVRGGRSPMGMEIPDQTKSPVDEFGP